VDRVPERTRSGNLNERHVDICLGKLSLRSPSAEPCSEVWENPVSRDWLPIRYRDFYDIPRLIAVEFEHSLYLFDCPFDEGPDDYCPSFTVYRLPLEARPLLDDDSWTGLTARGEIVGRVPTSDLELDESRRRVLKRDIFRRLR